MQVDKKLSGFVAGEIGSKDFSAWHRAWLAQQLVSELENSLYVEGWAVVPDSSLVVEHAWLELNGCIVDPARWDRSLTYFPALRFDKKQLLDAMVQQPILPVSWRSTASLPANADYYRARQAACAFAQARLENRTRVS